MSTLIALLPIPLILYAGVLLSKNYDDVDSMLPSMTKTLMFSRLTGGLFVIGLLLELEF